MVPVIKRPEEGQLLTVTEDMLFPGACLRVMSFDAEDEPIEEDGLDFLENMANTEEAYTKALELLPGLIRAKSEGQIARWRIWIESQDWVEVEDYGCELYRDAVVFHLSSEARETANRFTEGDWCYYKSPLWSEDMMEGH
jgi:hypothetical protein